jgi:hypothetical protein
MTPDLDAVIRSLDPAPTGLTPAQRGRAAASLDRLVATAPGPSPRVRRRVRPLLVLPTAAVALAAGVLMLPRGERIAFTSWTATPTALTTEELAVVAPVCRDRLAGGSLDLDRARLALAERRGEFVALLYRTEDPDMSGSCVAHHRAGTSDVDDVHAGIGGASGPALRPRPRAFTQGAFMQTADVSVTDGAVGSQVRAVTLHAGGLTVQASVRDGRYVAWWPGKAFRDVPADSAVESPPAVTYDLTLVDGTVIRNAAPQRPA